MTNFRTTTIRRIAAMTAVAITMAFGSTLLSASPVGATKNEPLSFQIQVGTSDLQNAETSR